MNDPKVYWRLLDLGLMSFATDHPDVTTDAVSKYADDVRNGTYPSEAESYALPSETAEALDIENPTRDSKAEKS